MKFFHFTTKFHCAGLEHIPCFKSVRKYTVFKNFVYVTMIFLEEKKINFLNRNKQDLKRVVSFGH